MFRATMCPSSGADDCVVLSPRVGVVTWLQPGHNTTGQPHIRFIVKVTSASTSGCQFPFVEYRTQCGHSCVVRSKLSICIVSVADGAHNYAAQKVMFGSSQHDTSACNCHTA